MYANITVLNISNVDLFNFADSFAEGLDLFLPPILMLLGIITNSLVVAVMQMKCFKTVSTSLYILLNAIVDNMTLSVAFPAHWIHVNFPEAIYRGVHADLLCKFFHFIGSSTSNLGIALTAAMTVERSIAVKLPLMAARVCTRRKAKFVMLALAAGVFVKDIHFLLKSQMAPETTTAYLCEVEKSTEAMKLYAEQIWPISQNVFLFASFIVIVICNILITTGVQDTNSSTSDSFIVGLTNRNSDIVGNVSRRTTRVKQITIMLIIDSVTVIVCTLPFTLLEIVKPSFEDPGMSHLVYSITFYLMYINRCANFFLYCVSGSRFRNALKGIFCKRVRDTNLSVYHVRTPNDTTTASTSG